MNPQIDLSYVPTSQEIKPPSMQFCYDVCFLTDEVYALRADLRGQISNLKEEKTEERMNKFNWDYKRYRSLLKKRTIMENEAWAELAKQGFPKPKMF